MNETTRTAIVTGAARGLGRAMTLGLSKAGIAVAALDLADSAKELGDTALEARAAGGGRVEPVVADITRIEQCAAAVEAVLARLGGVDILVNNAAINESGVHMARAAAGTPMPKFYELDHDHWVRLIDTNVNGAFRMAKVVAPHLVAAGWGRIVNITTSFPTMTGAGFSPYGPSKAALEACTAVWSRELAGTGVTVNVLIPGGAADTRLVPTGLAPDRSRLVAPAKMVPPLLWIVSQAADGITGRRWVASAWDEKLPPAQAAEQAGAPVAW